MASVTKQPFFQKGVTISSNLLIASLKSAPNSAVSLIFPTMLNQVLRNNLRDGDLDFLEANTLALVIDDTDKVITISKDQNRLAVLTSNTLTVEKYGDTQNSTLADVVIRGPITSFMSMLSGIEDPDTLFFKRKISITGNTDLSLAVKNMLATLEPEIILPKPLLIAIKAFAGLLYENTSHRSSEYRFRSEP